MDISTKPLPGKRPFWPGFSAGLTAGAIASGVMLLLSNTFGGLSLPEVFGSALTALMPISLFGFLHQFIGENAKYIFFYGILIGQCLVFALAGGLYRLGRTRWQARQAQTAETETRLTVYDSLLLSLLLWLFAGGILLPLTGAGFFGLNLSVGLINSLWSLAVVGLVFGLLYVPIHNWLIANWTTNATPAPAERSKGIQASREQALRRQTRRTLLQRGLVIGGIGILGVGIWEFISNGFNNLTVPVASSIKGTFKSKIVPPPVPNYGSIVTVPQLSPEITSSDQYYVVSKNLFSDPNVAAAGWQLKISGQVEQPFSLSYQELLAMPLQKQYESMMCISNEVGGTYMSNALWEGVRLNDLLTRAGLKPGATKVAFHCNDDYTDSFHLSKALEPTTLLALHMNGTPLPQTHGFPARLLVPGIYGMKHGKWINTIEVVNYDFQGYWQQRGWSDPAPIKMTARIDTPLDGITVNTGQRTYIAGVAFSGKNGISEVDISFDRGLTWERATLKRPLSALTWVLWELPWQVPAKSGSYVIMARAIDLAGNVQSPREAPPLPDGSSGYHTIYVTAV